MANKPNFTPPAKAEEVQVIAMPTVDSSKLVSIQGKEIITPRQIHIRPGRVFKETMPCEVPAGFMGVFVPNPAIQGNRLIVFAGVVQGGATSFDVHFTSLDPRAHVCAAGECLGNMILVAR